MSEAPNAETRAREMSWVPKEEFKGDPEKWVPAETWIERSETVAPFLRKTNDSLRSELTSVRGELTKVASALAESQASMKEFAEFQSELTADRVKAAKATLLRELAEAKKEENHEDEVRITDELTQMNIAAAEAAREKKEPPVKTEQPTTTAQDDPVYSQWIGENAWFLQDKKRRDYANFAALRLRGDPNTAAVVGRPFLDLIKKEVDEMFGGQEGSGTRTVDRVEGGRGSGNYGGGGGNGKSYADLPADAREVCTRQATRFVGDNKAFKDLKGWQDHYAKVFFAGEE